MSKTQKDKKVRQLIEGALGVRISRANHIHHLDGNHDNDVLDNLAIVSPRVHYRLHNPGILNIRNIYGIKSVADEIMHLVALELTL